MEALDMERGWGVGRGLLWEEEEREMGGAREGGAGAGRDGFGLGLGMEEEEGCCFESGTEE